MQNRRRFDFCWTWGFRNQNSTDNIWLKICCFSCQGRFRLSSFLACKVKLKDRVPYEEVATIGTQMDMWEFGTSRAAAWNCPATVMLSPEAALILHAVHGFMHGCISLHYRPSLAPRCSSPSVRFVAGT